MLISILPSPDARVSCTLHSEETRCIVNAVKSTVKGVDLARGSRGARSGRSGSCEGRVGIAHCAAK